MNVHFMRNGKKGRRREQTRLGIRVTEARSRCTGSTRIRTLRIHLGRCNAYWQHSSRGSCRSTVTFQLVHNGLNSSRPPKNYAPSSNHGPVGDRLYLDPKSGARQTEGMNDSGCRRFLHQSRRIFLIELQFHLAIGGYVGRVGH